MLVCLHLLIVWFIICNIWVTDKRIKKGTILQTNLLQNIDYIEFVCLAWLIWLICCVWFGCKHTTHSTWTYHKHMHTHHNAHAQTLIDWCDCFIDLIDFLVLVWLICLIDWFHPWIAWLICLLNWVIVLLDWFVCLIGWFICSFLLKSAASHFVI